MDGDVFTALGEQDPDLILRHVAVHDSVVAVPDVKANAPFVRGRLRNEAKESTRGEGRTGGKLGR
jgi:hypothetical protein